MLRGVLQTAGANVYARHNAKGSDSADGAFGQRADLGMDGPTPAAGTDMLNGASGAVDPRDLELMRRVNEDWDGSNPLGEKNDISIEDAAAKMAGANVKSTTVKKPVSYTHLDVYKRQILVGLTDGGLVYELDGSQWVKCTEEDAYAPLVLVNGKGDKYSTLPAGSDTEAAPASLFEGVNVLFGRFRASYFTDGVSSVFQLPFTDLADKPVHIEYLSNAKFSTTIPAGQTDSPVIPLLANAFARVDREAGTVSLLHRAGAVSYTHLDVYKRQGLRRPAGHPRTHPPAGRGLLQEGPDVHPGQVPQRHGPAACA